MRYYCCWNLAAAAATQGIQKPILYGSCHSHLLPVLHLPTIACSTEEHQRAGAGLPANKPVVSAYSRHCTRDSHDGKMGKKPKTKMTDVSVKGRWKDITQQVKSQDKEAFSL